MNEHFKLVFLLGPSRAGRVAGTHDICVLGSSSLSQDTAWFFCFPAEHGAGTGWAGRAGVDYDLVPGPMQRSSCLGWVIPGVLPGKSCIGCPVFASGPGVHRCLGWGVVHRITHRQSRQVAPMAGPGARNASVFSRKGPEGRPSAPRTVSPPCVCEGGEVHPAPLFLRRWVMQLGLCLGLGVLLVQQRDPQSSGLPPAGPAREVPARTVKVTRPSHCPRHLPRHEDCEPESRHRPGYEAWCQP